MLYLDPPHQNGTNGTNGTTALPENGEEEMNAQPQVDHRLPFGRHQGQPLDTVPADYLRWAIRDCRLSSGLRTAVAGELQRPRLHPTPTPSTTAVVDTEMQTVREHPPRISMATGQGRATAHPGGMPKLPPVHHVRPPDPALHDGGRSLRQSGADPRRPDPLGRHRRPAAQRRPHGLGPVARRQARPRGAAFHHPAMRGTSWPVCSARRGGRRDEHTDR